MVEYRCEQQRRKAEVITFEIREDEVIISGGRRNDIRELRMGDPHRFGHDNSEVWRDNVTAVLV